MIPDDRAAFAEESERFLAENPDVESIEVLLTDSNGIARGKWLPVDSLPGLAKNGIHLPVSVFGETIWLTGDLARFPGLSPADPDGVCFPVPGTLRRIPWRARPAAQLLLTMHEAEGCAPHPLDPRQILARLEARFAESGRVPVVATEYEFHLFSRGQWEAVAPRPPLADALGGSRLYELDALRDAESFLDEVRACANEQAIPATAVIAEVAPNQFEINLAHVQGACRAGDLAVQFKRLVKGVAAKHGLDATFMAKPLPGQPGNGCHIHASITGRDGGNLFDEAEARPGTAGPLLRAAVGGCLDTAPELQLLFAPHANSYRRYEPRVFAPERVCWGYDHREASIRLPECSGANARFEHRVAGADAQPYLVLAAILGGVFLGMEQSRDPGPPVDGEGRADTGRALTRNWREATERFADSAFAAELLGTGYRDLYAEIKRFEQEEMERRVPDIEYEACFRRV